MGSIPITTFAFGLVSKKATLTRKPQPSALLALEVMRNFQLPISRHSQARAVYVARIHQQYPIPMTDQTKLRDAVARAVDPEAYDNDEYTQIKARRRVYAELAADRILALPEIADAMKREEDAEMNAAVERLRKAYDFEPLAGSGFVANGDEINAALGSVLKLSRKRAAMSGGEKLDGKDTPQDGK